MSYLLPHLKNGWAVDQAILSEEKRVVVIRFGHDYDATCMQMDEILCGIAEDVKNFATIAGTRNCESVCVCVCVCVIVFAFIRVCVLSYCLLAVVDISEVPDFNTMYELYDPCTVMFFFRNKHIMIDLGTGNNNKINWALNNKQEMIDIIETVYRGAKKGRGLVISPKDYSTKYRY